ncbi:MAG: DUF3892 domain-containing protein [Tumebacillaceae bacterium]
MAIKITHIRLSNPTTDSPKHITHVKVDQYGNSTYTVQQIVQSIREGYGYYYTDRFGSSAEVEAVNAQPPYIKTKANRTTVDNLLSLPRF